jgi:hypothetical protein
MTNAVLNADIIDAVLGFHMAQAQQKKAWHRETGDVDGSEQFVGDLPPIVTSAEDAEVVDKKN